MPPRKSHKKSRAGCRRCKVRKIKCDEVHPRCGNCSKHGVICDFEDPALTHRLVIPNASPRIVTAASPSVGAPSPSASTLPPTPVPRFATPTPLYRAPEHPPLSATSQNNRLMELKLLHHFTTATCSTLNVNRPLSRDVWRETVPGIAFRGNVFLADALLAVSALHLRSRQPHDRELMRATHSYMASTLSEYSATLSRGINEDNAEALFLTASLIAFQSTASRIFARDEGGDLKDKGQGAYILPLSWFHSFQGVKAVVASSWHFLRNSNVVLPIIESQPALNLDLSEQGPSFFGHLLDGLDAELDELSQSHTDRKLTTQAYRHAVAVLDWAHKISDTGAPMVFLATVSRRFMELLEERRPRALAILTNFFGLLRAIDKVWWLKGVARREVMGLISMFDPDDAQWPPKLQWPLQIVLYEGDTIPPEIWGADFLAESQKAHFGSSSGEQTNFVTHIELLSKMFSAMQQMPSPGEGDIMDMVGQAETIREERIHLSSSSSPDSVQHSGLHIPHLD